MKSSKEDRTRLALLTQHLNNILTRTNLVVTLSEGESIEMSDGVTFTYSKSKTARQISISIKAPENIYAYRVKAVDSKK
jgi:Global regulator protein family